MMGEEVMVASGLAKSFGPVEAVRRIDLEVRQGDIYAFLGRNGAGKSTTIRMLLGLAHPTAGEVSIFGQRVTAGGERSYLRNVGYLVEGASAYAGLTVKENLEIGRRWTGADRGAVGRALSLFNLERYKDRRAGALSMGNLQRLALARATLHGPKLLILDEPINGLDPAGIIEVRSLLRRLAEEEGVTIFLSSHILSEVWKLSTRVGIVREGVMVEELDQLSLKARLRKSLRLKVSDREGAMRILVGELGLAALSTNGGGEIVIEGGDDRAAQIARTMVTAGHDLTGLCVAEEDLEDLFIRLTGEAA